MLIGRRHVSRLLRLSAELTIGLALVDPARLLLQCACLRRAMAKCPELFDGEIAGRELDIHIADVLAELAELAA